MDHPDGQSERLEFRNNSCLTLPILTLGLLLSVSHWAHYFKLQALSVDLGYFFYLGGILFGLHANDQHYGGLFSAGAVTSNKFGELKVSWKLFKTST